MINSICEVGRDLRAELAEDFVSILSLRAQFEVGPS